VAEATPLVQQFERVSEGRKVEGRAPQLARQSYKERAAVGVCVQSTQYHTSRRRLWAPVLARANRANPWAEAERSGRAKEGADRRIGSGGARAGESAVRPLPASVGRRPPLIALLSL